MRPRVRTGRRQGKFENPRPSRTHPSTGGQEVLALDGPVSPQMNDAQRLLDTDRVNGRTPKEQTAGPCPPDSHEAVDERGGDDDRG